MFDDRPRGPLSNISGQHPKHKILPVIGKNSRMVHHRSQRSLIESFEAMILMSASAVDSDVDIQLEGLENDGLLTQGPDVA
jgi:hypothetical protein